MRRAALPPPGALPEPGTLPQPDSALLAQGDLLHAYFVGLQLMVTARLG